MWKNNEPEIVLKSKSQKQGKYYINSGTHELFQEEDRNRKESMLFVFQLASCFKEEESLDFFLLLFTCCWYDIVTPEKRTQGTES